MKKVLKIVLAVVLAIILVFAVAWLVRYYAGLKRDQDAMEAVQTAAGAQLQEADGAQPAGDSQEASDTALPLVDLAAAKAENSDVVSWLRWSGEGSVIDYPVLQSSAAEGEDYYLTHNVGHDPSVSGALYIQQVDSPEFSDYITVIYGHNMRNGSMFKGLHRFEDRAYFDTEENRVFELQTADSLQTYKAYAAIRFGNELIPAAYDETSEEGRQQFLDAVASCEGFVDSSMSVSPDDRLLVLSTCVPDTHAKRYIVVCVRVDEKPLAAR